MMLSHFSRQKTKGVLFFKYNISIYQEITGKSGNLVVASIKRPFGSSTNDSKEEPNLYQKIKAWMNPFIVGTKGLVQETKEAWNIRKRIQNGETCTRKEMALVQRNPRDLKQSLPLVVFFAIPWVGGLAPFLGYKYPRTLLSWQFWTPQQKIEFCRKNVEERMVYYNKLRSYTSEMDSSKNKGLEQFKNIISNNGYLTIYQLLQYQSLFHDDQPLNVNGFTQDHIYTLSLANDMPLLPQKLSTFFEKDYLMNKLKKIAEDIKQDDKLLVKEGAEKLSLDDLQYACALRAITCDYGNEKELRQCLGTWLKMYSSQVESSYISIYLQAPAFIKFDELLKN